MIIDSPAKRKTTALLKMFNGDDRAHFTTIQLKFAIFKR